MWQPPGRKTFVPDPCAAAAILEQTDANNDKLRQFEAEIEALLDEVPAARALDDPVLTLGINALPTDSFSFSQEPMNQKQIFIAQRFPWFGKLDLKSQKVALAAARRKMRQALRLELHRVELEAYFELAFIDRSLEVNAELQQMVGQILRVAEAAYASGRGLQQDVLQAQVELGKLIDEKNASLQVGSGHVMRCLTCDALRPKVRNATSSVESTPATCWRSFVSAALPSQACPRRCPSRQPPPKTPASTPKSQFTPMAGLRLAN